jgi:hypothetical protein
MSKSYIERRRKLLDPKRYRHLPEVNIIGDNSEIDNIYYTLQIYNDNSNYNTDGNTQDTTPLVIANFSQNRSDCFINKPSDYRVSVTHFNIGSTSLPLQLVYPKIGTSLQVPVTEGGFTISGVETIYEITLDVTYVEIDASISTKTITIPVYWLVSEADQDLPSFPISVNQLSNEYFWNYSYEYFLNLVNNSINYAIAKIVADNGITFDDDYPYFSFDANTRLISFNAPLSFQTDIEGNSSIIGGTSWKIQVNEPLYQLLQGMPSIYNLKYQLLVISNQDGSNIIPHYNDIATYTQNSNYIKMTTEYKSIYLWNPVVSIVFTSPYFNIVPELQGLPSITGITSSTIVNNADILNILFEYIIDDRTDPIISGYVDAEYRFTDIVGIQPESEFHVNAFWKDSFGVLHQFMLRQGGRLKMNILFEKKDSLK